MGDASVLFESLAGLHVLRAGDLVAVVQIVDGVEDGIAIGDLHDGAVGKDLFHAGDEDVPLVSAVEIVAHEEAAAEEVLAHGGGLGIGQIPVAHLDGVEPGPIVNVAVIEVKRLLDGAHVNAGEPAEGRGEMAVGAGVIHGPIGAAIAPVAGEVEAAAPGADGRIHEPREGPLGPLLVVGGDGIVGILQAGVFFPRLLRGI